MSEMGPISSSSRRCCRMSSCPAANGMSDSRAMPIATEAPCGTKRVTASAMDISFMRSADHTVGDVWRGYPSADRRESHTAMTQNQPPAEPFGRLSPQEVSSRVSSGELKIVDVRENWEYARDHIPNATLTPLGQIISRPQEAITVDNVVFVCEVGQRSAVAAEMAAALGMQHVYNLEGGMQAWRTAGLPTEN